MSADQPKQMGILRGARSHQWGDGFIKKIKFFKKNQELKGQREKFKNQLRFLVEACTNIPWLYHANFFVRLSV
jgi:hypothetical protein